MNGLMYLLQVNLYLLLFYLFYLVLLRNETFFKMNRLYLMGSALLSLCIPVIKTGWIKNLFITEKVQEFTQSVTYTVITPGIEQLNMTSAPSPNQPWLTTAEWIWLIYVMVSLVFLINFLRKLYQVNSAFKMKFKGRAFSFFGKIAVDEELEGKETIVKHELVHARQWHSADVIFFELFLAMNWFNPVAYVYRNAIKNIHEFIADDSAASTLEDRSAYALLLVSSVFNTQPQRLTNNFFNQSLLKRRIIMLHKTKSRKVAILKYGLSVPLFAMMIIFSSATGADTQIINNISKNIYSGMEKTQPFKLDAWQETEKPVKAKAPRKQVDAVSKKNDEIPVAQNEDIPLPKNLYDHIKKSMVYRIGANSNGMVYYRFDVDSNQNIGVFNIIKSSGPNWADQQLENLNRFAEKVDLKPGTYNIYQFFACGIYDDELARPDSTIKTIMGFSKVLPIVLYTYDNTDKGEGNQVNYIGGTFDTPMLVINEKESDYETSDRGLKIPEFFDPMDMEKVEVLKGEKAVALYGEKARKGLILILTKTYVREHKK